MLDLFAGDRTSANIEFADGHDSQLSLTGTDVGRLIKVAVIWKSPVDLDLHAMEYAARRGDRGHRSAATPGDADSALRQMNATGRAHGFISHTSTAAVEGDKLEVYTLWQSSRQRRGLIALAIENKSRGRNPSGDHCGQGRLASVAFQVVRWMPGRPIVREGARLGAVACGRSLSPEVMLNQAAIRDLSLRR